MCSMWLCWPYHLQEYCCSKTWFITYLAIYGLYVMVMIVIGRLCLWRGGNWLFLPIGWYQYVRHLIAIWWMFFITFNESILTPKMNIVSSLTCHPWALMASLSCLTLMIMWTWIWWFGLWSWVMVLEVWIFSNEAPFRYTMSSLSLTKQKHCMVVNVHLRSHGGITRWISSKQGLP